MEEAKKKAEEDNEKKIRLEIAEKIRKSNIIPPVKKKFEIS